MTALMQARESQPAPVIVNKTNLPHRLDAGLGARLRIGLIELATDQTSEHEFRRLLDLPGIDFYQSRIWNDANITPATLAAMEQDIEAATRVIMPDTRLDVIGFTCTSGAMVIGEDTVFRLIRKVRPGIPCTSPITGAIAGMHALGLKRIALLTPYIQSINDMMRAYIEARGVAVPVKGSFNNPNDDEVARITLELDAGCRHQSRALGARRRHLRVLHVDPDDRHHPRSGRSDGQADACVEPRAGLALAASRWRRGRHAPLGPAVHGVIMPRLFTGIELPEGLRMRLARLGDPLPGARWLKAENIHLTLRFAGDVDNRTAADFAEFLEGITASAFELRLSGLGAFGGNDPRVIWAGVENSAELESLARANERAARNAGLPPESRKFAPHVTLARLRNSRPEAVARYLGRHGGFRSEAFTVSRFVLFSSRPQTGGGPYVVERAFPFDNVFDEDSEDHEV